MNDSVSITFKSSSNLQEDIYHKTYTNILAFQFHVLRSIILERFISTAFPEAVRF